MNHDKGWGNSSASRIGNMEIQASTTEQAGAGLNLFDLNVAAQEFDGETQENVIEDMCEPILVPVTTSSNACSSILQTIATCETIASEERDEEEEIQSQEVNCTPQDAYELSSMVFDSWEQAKSYYNKYAKKIGFSIKIGGSKNNKDGEKDKVMFVCNRNGSNQEASEGPVVKQRKRNKTEKTGCMARLTVKKGELKWHVTTFHEDHNHPVCDKVELKRFLRSHRAISEEEKKFV
ncbi:hypothetical protein C2845_PM17G07370 [Panicum miliaceum]|uniref:FAR1 domain-containing protein n=1 Tax=Panicum miliaceum TaxID=4540 RepID=A0A3L6Q1E6_PANMI|nr:hypothetical protein C2845_PM17G07370 [Panicum miliaceum]